MVKIRGNPIKMDDLGVLHPHVWKHPYKGLKLELAHNSSQLIPVMGQFDSKWDGNSAAYITQKLIQLAGEHVDYPPKKEISN